MPATILRRASRSSCPLTAGAAEGPWCSGVPRLDVEPLQRALHREGGPGAKDPPARSGKGPPPLHRHLFGRSVSQAPCESGLPLRSPSASATRFRTPASARDQASSPLFAKIGERRFSGCGDLGDEEMANPWEEFISRRVGGALCPVCRETTEWNPIGLEGVLISATGDEARTGTEETSQKSGTIVAPAVGFSCFHCGFLRLHVHQEGAPPT